MTVLSRRLQRAEAALAQHYGRLTPEERFRLIFAAGARGDGAEQDRLVGAGGRVMLSVPEHTPFAYAFDELALHAFIELLAQAADYLEALGRADDAEPRAHDAEPPADGEDGPQADRAAAGDVGAEDDGDQRTAGHGLLDLALAKGFSLKASIDGWAVFRARLNLPPFALWQHLPGFDRLRRALKLAEQAAFLPAGMVRWLNRARPEGEPEVCDVPFTPEEAAASLDRYFRERVAWWGG